MKIFFFFLTFILSIPNLCFSFSAKDFEENRKRICQPFTPDERDDFCRFENFEIIGHDLNKDGTKEWFIYGPKPMGGAHENCNLSILEHGKSGWRLLFQDYGNSHGDRVLKTSHQGYADLNISFADSAVAWTKQKTIWNGKNYQAVGHATHE